MRLSNKMKDILLHAAKESFGDVDIFLFGSRVDDSRRGGDIDIAIKTDLEKEEFSKKRLQFQTLLFRLDFEIPVDVVQLTDTMNELLKLEVSHGIELR